MVSGPKRTTRVVNEILPGEMNPTDALPDVRQVEFTVLRRNPWLRARLDIGVTYTCRIDTWRKWARNGEVQRFGSAP